MEKIPFFVTNHSTTNIIERIAKEYPELYAQAKKPGDLAEKEREKLREVITDIFR